MKGIKNIKILVLGLIMAVNVGCNRQEIQEVEATERTAPVMVNVEEVGKKEIKVTYSDGYTSNMRFGSELECAETYSYMWYEINEK